MGTPIEGYIYNGILSIAGSPIIVGLLVLGFFFAIVFVRNFRLDAKLLILIPACFLVASFIPEVGILLILTATVILFLGLNKLLNRQ